MRKYIIVFLVIFSIIFANAVFPYANTNSTVRSATSSLISNFVAELNKTDDEYEIWLSASPKFAYNLYSYDLSTVVASLYYMSVKNVNVGYVIIDTNNSIIEFSIGAPAYDNFLRLTSRSKDEVNDKKKATVLVYSNGIPGIYDDGAYSNIYQSGEPTEFDGSKAYNPQGMGSANCIVAAISNLMWFWKDNGYPLLASNMTFENMLTQVNTVMVNKGGYANANIPNTIKDFVKGKSSSYSATVTNVWSPTFANVTTEVTTNSRPCLLGFAADSLSPYSTKEGHMTVCVGTRTASSINYVKLMDGWSTSVVEKTWNTQYNDFISKSTLSK